VFHRKGADFVGNAWTKFLNMFQLGVSFCHAERTYLIPEPTRRLAGGRPVSLFLCCTWELSKFDPEITSSPRTPLFWREIAYLFLLNEKCSNICHSMLEKLLYEIGTCSKYITVS